MMMMDASGIRDTGHDVLSRLSSLLVHDARPGRDTTTLSRDLLPANEERQALESSQWEAAARIGFLQ